MKKLQPSYPHTFNLSEIDNAGVGKVINVCLTPKIATLI